MKSPIKHTTLLYIIKTSCVHSTPPTTLRMLHKITCEGHEVKRSKNWRRLFLCFTISFSPTQDLRYNTDRRDFRIEWEETSASFSWVMVQSTDTSIRTHGLRTQPRPSQSGHYICPVSYMQILRLPFVPVDGVGKSTLITSLIKESFVANVSTTCRAKTKGHGATAIMQELLQTCEN